MPEYDVDHVYGDTLQLAPLQVYYVLSFSLYRTIILFLSSLSCVICLFVHRYWGRRGSLSGHPGNGPQGLNGSFSINLSLLRRVCLSPSLRCHYICLGGHRCCKGSLPGRRGEGHDEHGRDGRNRRRHHGEHRRNRRGGGFYKLQLWFIWQ